MQAMAGTSFALDVKPLFKPGDIRCMSGQGVLLADYAYMSDPGPDATYADHANARHVYARLSGAEGPRMPMGGPYWSDAMVNTFASWMGGGFLA